MGVNTFVIVAKHFKHYDETKKPQCQAREDPEQITVAANKNKNNEIKLQFPFFCLSNNIRNVFKLQDTKQQTTNELKKQSNHRQARPNQQTYLKLDESGAALVRPWYMEGKNEPTKTSCWFCCTGSEKLKQKQRERQVYLMTGEELTTHRCGG